VFANAGVGDNNDTFTDTLDSEGNLQAPDLLTIHVNVIGVIFSKGRHIFVRSTPTNPCILLFKQPANSHYIISKRTQFPAAVL